MLLIISMRALFPLFGALTQPPDMSHHRPDHGPGAGESTDGQGAVTPPACAADLNEAADHKAQAQSLFSNARPPEGEIVRDPQEGSVHHVEYAESAGQP
ncbi:hypothetical protein [Streptomyces sp. NPDC059928]|uniref:hypothetical protein n=1 Tax=unclassified Streptomyces TaxID=2593676 RepID=UPI00365F0685